MANIKPRYEVHKLPGKATRTYCKIRTDKDGKNIGGFDYTDVEVDAGFMVYVPSGASIRCWDEDHLRKLGFDAPATLVDMDTGDEMGQIHAGVLKSRSEQKTSTGRGITPSVVHKGDNE